MKAKRRRFCTGREATPPEAAPMGRQKLSEERTGGRERSANGWGGYGSLQIILISHRLPGDGALIVLFVPGFLLSLPPKHRTSSPAFLTVPVPL